MEIFTLEYQGFIISEPNMLLSNWFITVVCVACIYRLRVVIMIPAHKDYVYFFIMNGVGAFLGGLGHFLYYYTGQPLKAFAWIFIGLATFFLQRTAIDLIGKPASAKALKLFSAIKLILFLAALLFFQSFAIVLIDLAIGLFLIVVPIHIGHFIQTRNKGSLLTLSAIGIIVLSVIFPVFKISLHKTWFTFNDIGHVCMAASLFVIYLGAKRFSKFLKPSKRALT